MLTLNRPDAGNRLTTALAGEIAQTLEHARGDDTVNACVLTGAATSSASAAITELHILIAGG